jgi:hypothetical protein
VIEETPGVYRFQAVQTGPTTLSIRLEEQLGSNREQVWNAVATRLRAYLQAQGLPNVAIELANERPTRGKSGKFRHIFADASLPKGESSIAASHVGGERIDQ